MALLIIILMLELLEELNRQCKRPLSPALRAERSRLKQLEAGYKLLCENGIHTKEQLSAYIKTTERQVHALEKQRQSNRNKLRREKPPEEKEKLQSDSARITQSLSSLRKNLRTAVRIQQNINTIYKHLQTECQMEQEARNREYNRNR